MKGVQKAYPDLRNCLYFDIALGSHCVLYELQRERLNWLWYINQPEPELKVLFVLPIVKAGFVVVNNKNTIIVAFLVSMHGDAITI